ncbi:M43 family zinc metalloprotease [Lewinella sp. W8]|uniref:M43 family zinc metalloprotease n=1 Tax=Lewinella sp. W8 TaxID=2528208 RepID=UPI0011AAA4ED|nr:M43 family zinc metalloprotease [Lewinella sp. W8]MTB53459.1 T9SS type A sorting domain-containing protein [Lewinella sp. W8]
MQHLFTRPRSLGFLLVLLLSSMALQLRAQTTFDFEDFSGTLTTSPELEALGISFGTPSVNLNGLPPLTNQPLGPVTVFTRDDAPSGRNVGANCSSGIGCEFPSGAVLIEFAETTGSMSVALQGFSEDAFFVVYGYDENGNVERLTRVPVSTQWQTVSVPGAKGYVIDMEGGNAVRTFFMDDIVFTSPEPDPGRECGTGDELLERLELDPTFRQEFERIRQLTDTYLEGLLNERGGLAFGGEVITIPVVVHVVYNNATENISDAQIQSQIDILNEAYRATNTDISTVPAAFAPQIGDLRLQFALAKRDPDCNPTTGITRTATTASSFDFIWNASTATARNPVKFNSTNGKDGWPSDQYLNMWVCDLTGGLLGYGSWPADLAGRPAEDGVVIDYRYFGDTGTATSPFDLGRTAVHEVGHWLNLRHIWGDDNLETDKCSFSDEVDDTPNQRLQNTGCPTFPSVSCENGPNGDMFMNYMDYVDDDCMTMFTVGQHVRAAAALFTVRTDILGSEGSLPPPEAPNTPDLWSSDTYDDVGDEPNATTEVVYHSADIWVRPTNDGMTNQEHINPVYRADGTPNYVYVRIRNRGCGGTESGNVRLYWAKASSGLSWPAPWDGSVASPALMGSPLGAQAVSVAGGEFTVLEFPWVVPNPADYASFGADRAHFCLLSRIEDADGMTFPETGNLWNNVKNNNNIVWKNISIGTETTPGGRQTNQVIVANYEDGERLINLDFDLPQDAQRSIYDYGQVFVNLGPLYERWENNGGQGAAVEPLGDGLVAILDKGASIEGIPLEPGALVPVDVLFDPFPQGQINTVHRLNMTQVEAQTNAPIGGNQFRFPTFAPGILFPEPGGGTGQNFPPVFVDCPDGVPTGCEFPVTVRVDMSNVPEPDNFLGNFTGFLRYDQTVMEYVGGAEVLSGYAGFVNPLPGVIAFNGADANGQAGDVAVFRATFRALAAPGSVLATNLEVPTLASAVTFRDLSTTATIFDCEFPVLEEQLLGDVNGDGLINSTDAAMILAFSVGNPIPAIALERIEAGIGNVDGNNRTNARDALIILTYEIGLPVDFPVGTPVCPNQSTDSFRGEEGGRSALTAPVEIMPELEEDGQYLIPVVVDLSDAPEALGSYQLQLDWDINRFAFAALVPSPTPGFERATVNESRVAEGVLRMAHANPLGAGQRVTIAQLRLTPLTDEDQLPEVGIHIEDLSTAHTLRTITPEIVRNQTTSLADQALSNLKVTVVPNPSRGETQLQFYLPQPTHLEVAVFDGQGKQVALVADAAYGAGQHSFPWRARQQLSNGVYFVRIRSGQDVLTKRIVLLR